MPRNSAVRFIILFFFFFLLSCSRLKYDVVPDAAAVYHSLRIKVNVKNNDTGQRQNFKIILKYDGSRDKMVFLSPLNQVYGVLVVGREKALLINTKKKKYWKGSFNILLREIWGMDFNYSEFKRLIVEGIRPEKKLKKKGIEIFFEKSTVGETPGRIKIRNRDILVKVKISNRRTGKGVIRFAQELEGLQRTAIRQLLE